MGRAADRRSVAKPKRQSEPRHRRRSGNAGRRRAGCADRLCLGPRGRRRRNRCGGRPPHRNRYGERSGRFFRVSAPEALRHGLSAMHVCEGKPDPRCPAGASLWASARLWAAASRLWPAAPRLWAAAPPLRNSRRGQDEEQLPGCDVTPCSQPGSIRDSRKQLMPNSLQSSVG